MAKNPPSPSRHGSPQCVVIAGPNGAGKSSAAPRNFAFETTLSGKTVERLMDRALATGYEVHLYYLWLASADVAVARVRRRVELGGHDVPEAVIRRRYRRSLANMATYLTSCVTSWRLYDGGAAGSPRLVASGGEAQEAVVADSIAWDHVRRSLRDAK